MLDGQPAHEVLVLGARGRVGGAIIEELRAREVPVRAAAREPGQLEAGPCVRAVAFDMLRAETWTAALEGVRHMFLMWPPGTSPKREVFPFIEAASRAGVERVAFLSVLGADEIGLLPHHQIERRLQGSGLGYALLRAAYFMQNLSTTHAADVRERGEVSLPVGSGRLAMVDVVDVAQAACVGLLEREDDVAWDLTGAQALSMDEVAAELSRALARPIRNARPGALSFYRDHRRRGTPRGLAAFMVAEYTHARLGLGDRVADGVRRALGRDPTSFAEFAARERGSWSP